MFFLLLIIGLSCSISCYSQTTTMKTAYEMRYVSLDSARIYIDKAIKEGKGTKPTHVERALIFCNIGFLKYMQMEYDSAQIYYQKSIDETHDELVQLLADIGLMKICNIVSANKEFYQYKISAENIINNSAKHQDTKLWNYAICEYFFTMATYYNTVQMDDEARQMLHEVSGRQNLFAENPSQLSRFYHLQSSIGVGSIDTNLRLQYLVKSYTQAKKHNLAYLEGCALEQIASFLIHDRNDDALLSSYKQILDLSDESTDSIPYVLANRALTLFQEYGSVYSSATAYTIISSYYLQMDDLTKALDYANKSLALISKYETRTRFIPKEWISQIREQLSIVYAEIGDKDSSDYNRNIYLDMLEDTREDKMLEQRRDTLEAEQEQLQIILYAVYFVALLLFVTMIVVSITIYVKKRREAQELSEIHEKETSILQSRLRFNKRYYIDKCATLSIASSIYPLISRACVEMERQSSSESERLDYVRNLFQTIEQYNKSLSHLISIKQGTVKLNISQFALQPLFDIVELNSTSFEQAGITLSVKKNKAMVKADKSLTLFMINTLLDNARKFTDKGGVVVLDAQEREDYVEISVSDSGKGMSETQLRNIQSTGARTDGKGFGFGIMNCKGIIDKYKKTSKLFDVCRFLIESKAGVGTRVAFHLPRVLLCLLLSLSCFVAHSQPTDSLLTKAHEYADSVYFANVDHHYSDAIQMADSALDCLNRYYRKFYPSGTQVLVLNAGRYMPELDWWKDGVKSDYNTILDIRNEVAVAALALKNHDLYSYNNNVYLRLYKLCGQDSSLEDYCKTMASTNQRRQFAINTIITLLVLVVLIYTSVAVYFRRRAKKILLDDENRLIALENDSLHVENLILDNSLSSLKHETMYYPSRILSYLDNINNLEEKTDLVKLINYYKNIFNILCTQARQQLRSNLFKREDISVSELCLYLHNQLKSHKNIEFHYSCSDGLFVRGDYEMLLYFMENLASLITEQPTSKKTVSLDIVPQSNGFIRLTLTDDSLCATNQDNQIVFSPENLRYDTTTKRLKGIQYLILKQIIREHDDNSGKRGCKMYATGQGIEFTLLSSPSSSVLVSC